MFPRRYFALRYFAPRYFPQSQGVAPALPSYANVVRGVVFGSIRPVVVSTFPPWR